jgi:hypothetical protein
MPVGPNASPHGFTSAASIEAAPDPAESAMSLVSANDVVDDGGLVVELSEQADNRSIRQAAALASLSRHDERWFITSPPGRFLPSVPAFVG